MFRVPTQIQKAREKTDVTKTYLNGFVLMDLHRKGMSTERCCRESVTLIENPEHVDVLEFSVEDQWL